MARYSDITTLDANGTPHAGVYVTVKNDDGTLATLTADDGGAMGNPTATDVDGSFAFNVAPGIYSVEFRNSLLESPRIVQALTLPVSPGDGYPTRASMAGANPPPRNLDDAYLTEPGREGKFVFSTADLLTGVSGDPEQGRYIAPDSAPSGASGAWVRADRTLSVRDFGAKGDGATNDTAAFQAAFNALSANQSLDLHGGSYSINAVTMTGKSRVRIIGRGAQITERTAGTVSLVTFTTCPRLRFEDVHFVATETFAYFAANSPTARHRFLTLSGCDRARIKDVTGEGKRGHIYTLNSSNCIVEGSDFVGFFQNVSLGAQANANECPSIEFSGGRHNKALYCHAENHGSCVLWTLNGTGHSAFGCTGRNLHDNGVYGSSGTRTRAAMNDFSDVVGHGVKLRGSQNIAALNTAQTVSVAIGITGNGVTPDAYGANGFGNIAALNSGSDISADGINYLAQDGLHGRDTILALNTFEGITSTGGFAGLRGLLRQGGVLIGNIVNNAACDYGILHSGTAIQPQKTAVVLGNVTNDLNGAQQAIRIGFATESFFGGNVGSDVPNLIQGRSVTNSTFLGNVNPNGTSTLVISAANLNTGNLAIGHRGVTSLDSATNVGMINYPAANMPLISNAPLANGLITVNGAVGYVSTGTASSADWKQTTP